MKTIKQNDNNIITIDMIEQSGALTKDKCDILRHKSKTTYLISAKGSGKTIVAITAAILAMQDRSVSATGIRKWKSLSSTQLSKYWNHTANHLENYGLPIFSWKKSQNSIMRINSKSDSLKNNEFIFGSREKLSDYDGNSSKMGILILDEPLLGEDSNRLWTPKEIEQGKIQWENDLEMLRDNCFRYNQGEYKKNEKIFILANPWNKDDPIIRICEDIFPEEDYVKTMFLNHSIIDYLGNFELIAKDWEKLKDSFIKNNTQAVYEESTDTLVVRQNKFANPQIVENKEQVFKQIRYALENNDRGKLVMTLGIANDEFADSLNCFGNIDYPTTTIEELDEQGYKKVSACFSIDIDTTRQFTLATGILYKKPYFQDNGSVINDFKIYIAPMVEIPANGSGANGDALPIYSKLMLEHVHKQVEKYKLFTLNCVLLLDDKRKWFVHSLNNLRGDYPYIKAITTFEQHGTASIIHRQDLTQLGLNKKVILLDIKNQDLIQDWKVMKRVDVNDPKRITNGSVNFLDRIDAVEQCFWYYQAYINQPQRKA